MVLAGPTLVYGLGMIRRQIHWIIAILLMTFVVGACLVRTKPPPPRGRPVYVAPDRGHDHHKHKHDKHKHKHDKHKHRKHH